MGYHGCPIEPSDWSDGPDYEENCRNCEGTGVIGDNDDTCPDCDGSGFVPYEPMDDDVI